jgi:hypothetical protein
MPASAYRFSCGDMPSRSSALRQADMPITEPWLGDQIDATAGVAEHFFDLKQVRFRARRQHGRDSLGDRGGIARSLGDEKGLSLVESKRHDGEDSTGW